MDRYYVERFLNAHAEDIRGRVLEVAENTYTRQFGGDRVTQSDVLHLTGTRQSTIVADLTRGDGLATGAFDCIILTQTLQHIYDSRAAMQTIERILAPGGTLLVSVPGISQISRYDMQRWGDYWRFTSLALRRLLEEAFAPQQVEVQAFGNVLLATAFLQGLVVEDLPHDALGFNDPDYELIVCARASKSETPS
ncbi:MAG: methyltransferase domain-containing protein [Phycisphaerae bacterium]|nr:methyltransferase domain-containing protein [Phycisphaerae bacterium]